MLPQDIPFVLFANCLPVKGASRSVICDVQRREYQLIPNVLWEILTSFPGETLREIKGHYEAEAAGIIESYFEFLVDKEYLFFTQEPELFPPMDLVWEDPALITNAILDLDKDSCWNMAGALEQLAELGCKHLQWRCFDRFPLTFFENLLSLLDKSAIQSIEIYMCYDPEVSFRDVFNLCNQFHRIAALYIHDAPEDKVAYTSHFGMGHIFYHRQKIDSAVHCGVVSSQYFLVNLPLFTESLHFNSCLNKKIAVDRQGWIRNCPSMQRNFGHIENTRLAAALHETDFTALWHVTKDQVKVCRDCEFRYICTDCRAYLSEADQRDSKPFKCHYNPYNARWEVPEQKEEIFLKELNINAL